MTRYVENLYHSSLTQAKWRVQLSQYSSWNHIVHHWDVNKLTLTYCYEYNRLTKLLFLVANCNREKQKPKMMIWAIIIILILPLWTIHWKLMFTISFEILTSWENIYKQMFHKNLYCKLTHWHLPKKNLKCVLWLCHCLCVKQYSSKCQIFVACWCYSPKTFSNWVGN